MIEYFISDVFINEHRKVNKKLEALRNLQKTLPTLLRARTQCVSGLMGLWWEQWFSDKLCFISGADKCLIVRSCSVVAGDTTHELIGADGCSKNTKILPHLTYFNPVSVVYCKYS
ncbi:unnamed protein product [Strongylus vulgaris]|uniref:Uncharacterized protein n=1 Tax=Strongylus vulgaris TaxID=40348 RepID=A0A3P7JCX3_STRVU|nr:unnamed protein product [Strongylus vulgaris]